LLNDRPQKAELGLVLSLANSPTHKAIKTIPLMVFCQKIIGSCAEKISIHHTMPKALRPPGGGKHKQAKAGAIRKTACEDLDLKQSTAVIMAGTANAEGCLISGHSFR
jgi:hypothetical protein